MSQAVSRRMMQTDRVQRLRFELVATEFLVRMGARIEQHRKERGLSRADLARLLPGKVNENQIYRWERGKHNPNPDTLQAIADALGIDVAQIMAPAPTKPAVPDLSQDDDGQPTNAQILAAINQLQEQLEEQIRLLRAETTTRAAEVLRRIDDTSQPTAETRSRRRA